MVTAKGLARDPDMGSKIDRAVFPGLQGGPHDNTTAAIAVALKEAETPAFRTYAKQIVLNAKALAATLMGEGLTLTTGGTDNHLMVVDLRSQGIVGNVVAEALEVSGIVVNKNSVPHDSNPPFYPSGIRLGTPAATTRVMKESEMKKIGLWIAQVVAEVSQYRLPATKEERGAFLKKARAEIANNKKLLAIAREVRILCKHFPVP